MPKIGENKNLVKEKIQINPDKYWISVLILNFLIIVGAFTFGYFLFTNISLEKEADNSAPSKQGVKEKQLMEVLKIFTDRAINSEKIKLVPSGKVDPSL